MKKTLVMFTVFALLLTFNAGAALAFEKPVDGNCTVIYGQVTYGGNPYGQTGDWNHSIGQRDVEKWLNDLADRFIRDQGKQPAQLAKQAPAADKPVNQPSKQQPKPTEPKQSTKSDQTGMTTAEQQMLDLVNKERQKNGLKALKANNELVKVARVKAKDMIDKNYFDHQSPTYGSPSQMLDKFGISYRLMGENLAGHQSVEGAHNGLMNSPGHRANILKADFTEIGIGIVDGGPYGKMFVQLFKG